MRRIGRQHCNTSSIMIAILFLVRRCHLILFSEFLRTPLCFNLCETNYQKVYIWQVMSLNDKNDYDYLLYFQAITAILSVNSTSISKFPDFSLTFCHFPYWISDAPTLPSTTFRLILIDFLVQLMKGNWWFFCILLSFHLLYFSKEKYNQQKKEPIH